MNKIILISLMSLLTCRVFSAENTDKAKDEKTQINKIAEEQIKKHPCSKEPDGEECKKFISKIKATNPCMSDMEKLCKESEYKDPGENKSDIAKNMKACMEKYKSSLSKDCREYQEKKGLKPYNCNDKCMELKNDKQIDCLAKCIVNPAKK